MTDAERIADLLVEWEERREHGTDVPAEELCRDCPHLLPELVRRINALNVTSWMSEEDGGSPPAPSAPTAPPTLPLGGRYRLDGKIGEGGFAEVWKGYDLELRRAVAVKRPRLTGSGKTDHLERFVAEARRVAGLKHPGVVPVFDVGRDGDAAYIVSELVEGGSLAERIVTARPTVQESARLVAEVADTLAYAHRHGFLHRDIKPANVLIDHHGRALVADFGIARSPDDGAEPTSFGTLAYMAPEQVEGKPTDHRADIYSLGVVLYELLVGRLPHTAADPVALRREIVSGPPPLIPASAGVPERLATVCLKCLSRDPATRYQDAEALAHDLRATFDLRPPKRRRLVVAVAGFTALLILAVWGIFARQPAQEPRPTAAERAGAEWVFSVGGKVNDARRADDLAEPWPVHFAYLHRDHCDERVTDGGLVNLSGCPDLHTLNLGGAKIDGSGLTHLRGATKLTWLSLECTNVTDASLAHLSGCTELTYLNLLCTPVTDQAVETLLGFRKLEMVVLSSTNVTRQGVDRIRSGLPECRVVWEPPASLPAALSLGRLHWDKKQWHEAEAAFSEAIRLDPNNAETYHRRAGCRVNTKRVEDSLPDFDAAVRLDPKNPEMVKNRGIAHLNLLRFDAAIADLKHALDLGPPDPQPYRAVLGQAFAQRAVEAGKEKKWTEAVADLDEAIKLDPANAGYFDWRGGCYFNLGQIEEARKDFTEAVRLDPTPPAYRLHLEMTKGK